MDKITCHSNDVWVVFCLLVCLYRLESGVSMYAYMCMYEEF